MDERGILKQGDIYSVNCIEIKQKLHLLPLSQLITCWELSTAIHLAQPNLLRSCVGSSVKVGLA